MPFLTKLVVTEAPRKEWGLMSPLIYQGNKDEFTVPTGFTTDFASVPKILWPWFPPTGLYTKAAVLHDFHYITQDISRKDADGIFRRVMREEGVSKIRRYLMWFAVRIGGRYHKNINLGEHGL
jgi:hypothetical protein